MLARNHVGRLAFRVGERVTIQPLGYVARDNWLFLRSAYGAKLEAISRDPFVAFEVDEIDGPFDWRSVVVHGTIYMLSLEGGPIEQREAQRALEALRSAMPDAFSESDPVPDREILYGLNVHELSGRMAQSSADSSRGKRLAPKPQPTIRRPADTF